MRPARLAVLAFPLVASLAGPAMAQEPPRGAGSAQAGDARPDEALKALEVELAREAEALSVDNCAVACRALGAMQRVADRLCALDRGARCAAARARVREAEGRVRAACPDCGIASNAPPARPAEPPPADKPPPAPSPPEAAEAVRSKRGGCAGCEVGGDAGGALAAGALAAALVIARWLRRKRR
jgi:hypothetical protein